MLRFYSIFALFCAIYAAQKPYPIVILPSYFKLNSSNTISVTSVLIDKNVDVKVVLKSGGTQFGAPIKAKSIRPGIPRALSFRLENDPENLDVVIEVDDHSRYESSLPVRPDLFVVHLYTDKTIYRAGETVGLRALPLTQSGSLYDSPLEFILINSEGFELSRKVLSTGDETVIKESFLLPDHLFYGDWKIIVRPFGVSDTQLTYATNFQVRDYELPVFKLTAFLDEGNNVEETGVTIDARYFHGVPIDGTFTISCSNSTFRDVDRTNRIRVKAGELHNGVWSNPVNLTQCRDYQNFTNQIVVEVRDHGTGSRADFPLTWDILAPKFSLVPMKPYFSRNTTKILFMIDGDGIDEGTVNVSFDCIAQDPPNGEVAIHTVGDVSGVVQLDLPKQWRTRCSVVRATAKRKLKKGSTRENVMFVPNVQDAVMGANLMDLEDPKSVYQVGDVLTISLNTPNTKSLNYLILCNSQTLLRVESTRDDRRLQILITEKMKGDCILFVFSSAEELITDMLLFRVQDGCHGILEMSKVVDGEKYALPGAIPTIEPGQKIVLGLRSDSASIAFFRSIDDRLNHLPLRNDKQNSRYWDFSMFSSTRTKVYQARIVNLVNLNKINTVLATECIKAGNLLHTHCPAYAPSASVLSNICLKYILNGCNEPPKVSPVCSHKNNCITVNTMRKAGGPLNNIMQRLIVSQSTTSTTPIEFYDVGVPEEPSVHVRENFQEVWMFDAVSLGNNGYAEVARSAPDNIGQWETTAAFWTRGRTSMCPANKLYVQSKKSIFMDVDLPRDVYVNETVSVKITVTGINVQKLTKYSICMSDLARKACADEGSFGKRGRPAYTNVALTATNSVQSKTFTMRFLVTGQTNVTFMLREESAFPGKHHCEVGKVLDVVKLKLHIAKRADTIEYYKRILLNAGKPVVKIAMNDDVGQETSSPAIEVVETRSFSDPSSVVSTILANIHDTETVYSFSIDLSKFLPTQQFFEESQSRMKRGVVESENAFLTDVIKQLSVELYRFKTMANTKGTELYILEWSQNRISNLISDLLRFSDCTSQGDPCGYAEYGRPRDASERSIFLTSVATSLLCEASVDERLILGPIQTIIGAIQQFKNNSLLIDLHDVVDIESSYDKKYLLASVMFQVSRDCGVYQEKIKKNVRYEAFGALHRSYYAFDESEVIDERTIAAIAYMASNVTQELMRIKMLERINNDLEPYWSAGSITENKILEKKSTFEILSSRRSKSGDIMVNSLGLLAFITAGAEGTKIEWDPLADWLFKQQNEDGSFESPIDTYFASRALFEYRLRKVDIEHNSELQVEVSCSGCPTRKINITETPVQVHIPTHIRNVTLKTSGYGKVKAEVRIVATRRQRLRRGLSQDDYYPVKIDIDQAHIQSTTIRQTVCLTVKSPVLRTLEITHGIFTSYTTSLSLLSMLSNSTDVSIINPAKSSYAMHLTLVDIPHNRPICYSLGLSEPSFRHEPIYLAPVAIQARHPVSGIVGMVLVAHPDALVRPRRSLHRQRRHRHRHSGDSHRITIRSIVDESSVDTVCFEGGQCSCAETTCGVQCGKCNYDTTPHNLRNYLDQDDHFGARVKVKRTDSMQVQGTMYTVYHTEVTDSEGRGKRVLDDTLTILIRDCNPRCVPQGKEVAKDDKFLILGHVDGLTTDTNGTQHYVLRDSDRFEFATTDCQVLNNFITLGDMRY